MPDRSLRRTILFYTSTLLIVLIVAMLVFVNYRAEGFVASRMEVELGQGRERVVNATAGRIKSLHQTTALIASFPYFYALLQTKERVSVRDFLNSYKKDQNREELLVALDPEWHLIARTDRADQAPIPELRGDDGLLETGDDVYHFASAPVNVGEDFYGTIAAAARIDSEFAQEMKKVSGSDVVLAGNQVLGTSLGDQPLPWQTSADWESNVPLDGTTRSITVNGKEYFAKAVSLGMLKGIKPVAIIMQSHDAAIAPYRLIQMGLLVLGLIATVVGIGGSAVFAHRVTAPIATLVEGTQQVAAGNFDHRIDIDSRDEIGELAQSFNTMIKGLRERADMQKFVSQSTVDMIQSTSAKEVKAGERVTLTILFSDMRGFTSMADRLPPEETVRILNSCLSLQAARVKKFGGDIDKFVGDCVVALFDGEDKELHAIRCAVEIHKALDGRNAGSSDVEPVHVGIGIATGEVILGSIGSEDRLDYTVIGSHVNLCSRICSLAGPRETWMSQSTYDRVEGLVAAERLDPVRVKGFAEPVPLYRMKPTPLLS